MQQTTPRNRGVITWIDCNSDKPTIKEIWSSDKFKIVDEPEIGSVLIWKHKNGEEGYFSPTEIDESGKIISTKEYSYAHLGVFEDEYMVSDCSLEEGLRIIRLRRYRELPKPDIILTKIKQK